MIQLKEKRVHQPRLPTNMKARLIVPGQVAPAPCTITDISPGGARLQIDTQWILPRSFWLRIVGDASLHYCVMVWRKGEEVGVDFRRPESSMVEAKPGTEQSAAAQGAFLGRSWRARQQ